MSASSAEPVPPASSGKPTVADLMFMGFLVVLLMAVVALGRLTFKEGLKTEGTKAQAEALVAWMKESASPRQLDAEFVPHACSLKTGPGAGPTWAGCAAALFADRGPLAGARNTFSGDPLRFVERCVPGDASTVGQLVADKLTPTPPGSAVPVFVSPLIGDDRLDQRLAIRILVCDKGGYAIRVAETKF